jgi:hypothetical protein
MFHYWLSCYISADAENMRTMKYYCVRYCDGHLNDSIDVLSRKLVNSIFHIRDQDEGRIRNEEEAYDEFIPFQLPSTIVHRRRILEPTAHFSTFVIEMMTTPIPIEECKVMDIVFADEETRKKFDNDAFDCPICLETKEMASKRMTNCHHFLCSSCYETMAERDMFTCFLCRDTIHTVYQKNPKKWRSSVIVPGSETTV